MHIRLLRLFSVLAGLIVLVGMTACAVTEQGWNPDTHSPARQVLETPFGNLKNYSR